MAYCRLYYSKLVCVHGEYSTIAYIAKTESISITIRSDKDELVFLIKKEAARKAKV